MTPTDHPDPPNGEVDKLIHLFAPVMQAAADRGQDVAGELRASDWARTYMARNASLNQVAGTARWRGAGDYLTAHTHDFPSCVRLNSCDADHNGGRYWFRGSLGGAEVLFTVRQKAHADGEEPLTQQEQLEYIVKNAPIKADEVVTVYLSIPRTGEASVFIKLPGKDATEQALRFYLGDQWDDLDGGLSTPQPQPDPTGPIVESSRAVVQSDAVDEDV